jgi:hypothetical protein
MAIAAPPAAFVITVTTSPAVTISVPITITISVAIAASTIEASRGAVARAVPPATFIPRAIY